MGVFATLLALLQLLDIFANGSTVRNGLLESSALAETKRFTKIMMPEFSLNAFCDENIRRNLKKFLDKQSSRENRQLIDYDEDLFASIEENPSRANTQPSTFSQLTSAVAALPQLIYAFDVVRRTLKEVDIPDITKTVIRRGEDVLKLYQTFSEITHAYTSAPVQPIQVLHYPQFPNLSPPIQETTTTSRSVSSANLLPTFLATTTSKSEVDPVDYIEEIVNQYFQPSQSTIHQSNFQPVTENSISFIENANSNPTIQIVIHANYIYPNEERPAISLWNIYKMLSMEPVSINVTMKDSLLTNPEEFTKELLQNISSAITTHKEEMMSLKILPKHNPEPEIVEKGYPEVMYTMKPETYKPVYFSSSKFSKRDPTQKPKNFKVNSNKPVFWMNMFYPNGLPGVGNNVKTTTFASVGLQKRRRRTRSTTTTEATTTESLYYEDEDYAVKA